MNQPGCGVLKLKSKIGKEHSISSKPLLLIAVETETLDLPIHQLLLGCLVLHPPRIAKHNMYIYQPQTLQSLGHCGATKNIQNMYMTFTLDGAKCQSYF